ncbi:MAG: hypothetical protein DF168_01006 [Candidatus Moanabacter tarae]|uniref:Sulfur carrier protein ThiS n=1 Tax=Candidatus Moanibacter tarae TaxID=2200854 RepID=A0A2Z4ACY2_9BACT|nr:MAG: hypothetical protein DF168_01006 [Candidatus Moanabacter tarae]|tara:strand:- start:6057 stop:6341 length:285 start_codon:yes stop_codon:yes gene_type:complete
MGKREQIEGSDHIEIFANGESFNLEKGTLLPDFIESLNLDLDRVIVELNKGALSPTEATNIELKRGDILEIVRIVAGGMTSRSLVTKGSNPNEI